MHDFAQTQPKFVEALWRFLAPERLTPYKIDKETLRDMVVRYYWNVKLCESLYISLQNLEVVLRNAIYNRCFVYFDDEYWFEQTFFREQELEEICKSKESLNRQRKIVDGCRIVAELNFGYWTSLFNEIYEVKLFRPALISIFPNSPRECRKRKVFSTKLNEIRKLRNRVFHHEPIWTDSRLLDKHNSILEVIYWINKDMFHVTRSLDRFHDVYRSGAEQVFENMANILY